MLYTHIAAALIALSVGFGSGWTVNGWRIREAANAAKLASSEAARDDERLMNTARTRIDDARNQDLRAVGDRLADALERLRNRPARMPEAARAACTGSTGAELSGPDAAVLERLAARADQLRAELGACQDREWATYQALTR